MWSVDHAFLSFVEFSWRKDVFLMRKDIGLFLHGAVLSYLFSTQETYDSTLTRFVLLTRFALCIQRLLVLLHVPFSVIMPIFVVNC